MCELLMLYEKFLNFNKCSFIFFIDRQASPLDGVIVNGDEDTDQGNKNDNSRRVLRQQSMKPFYCPRCEIGFTSRKELSSHCATHKAAATHQCSVCEKSFIRKGHLIAHFRTHTGERPFPCGICGHHFTFECNLKQHLRLHTGERPYVCHICDKTFNRRFHLTAHLRTHTGAVRQSAFSSEKTVNDGAAVVRADHDGGRSWRQIPVKHQKQTPPNKQRGVGKQQQQHHGADNDRAVNDGADNDGILDDSSSDISMGSLDTATDTDNDNQNDGSSDSEERQPGREDGTAFSDSLSPIVIQPFTASSGVTHSLDDMATEMDFFNLLYTDDMLENMVVQTNLYAQQCGVLNPDPSWEDTSREEMRAFIGIHILMGIVLMPDQHMYWSTDDTFGKIEIMKTINGLFKYSKYN